MQLLQAIRMLTTHVYPDNEVLVDVWGIGDMKYVNEKLTNTQCVELMDHLQLTHNAEVGINWGVIKVAIAELFPDIAE